MENIKKSNSEYKRLKTREVKIGNLLLGNNHPIRLQTMTTPDTMDTEATVLQTIKCIEAGAELVRITAPSKKEAEHLAEIKKELNRRGYDIPLVADIHFTPNAAEIAAKIVEKVRINPGNYIDKKKFEVINYTNETYQEEIDRIQKRFTPLIHICKEYGTAMRIGTNHGSLSDRIMSRYGDTPMGMVESAMEFLRIARYENYHNIVLSMKSSNPQVMIQAYRLLVQVMMEEFGECYPLHLGVTEAGDGEDGRVKSAVGMGTLLEDGIGDTVRVSLTEEPELEIPVCRDLVKRYPQERDQIKSWQHEDLQSLFSKLKPQYKRRVTYEVNNIGGGQVPVVIADFNNGNPIDIESLQSIGYHYNQALDKWSISDLAADYIWIDQQELDFSLPGTLKVITSFEKWKNSNDHTKYFPLFEDINQYYASKERSSINFILLSATEGQEVLAQMESIKEDRSIVFLMKSDHSSAVSEIRNMFWDFEKEGLLHPIILLTESKWENKAEHLIHFATELGSLLIEGYGDGICLQVQDQTNSGSTLKSLLNTAAFSILQASRTRISKTEYISCPSCGRTLFDLQETTAKIRARTNHLKGVKIAIMGCIVNGPGEMADADFGYVGSGVGKITLYKNKEVVKRGIDSAIAVDELINLLKENGVWVEPQESNISENIHL